MRTLLLLLALPFAVQAQTKSDILADWERQRANVLAYVDAMPDSAMDFRPTPGVRGFAQQVDHAVTTNLQVAAEALRGVKGTPLPRDTAAIFHRKAALREYTERTFAYVLDAIRVATPALLLKPTSVFGLPPQANARLLALAYEHAAWTMGQTVPYLRLNGVTPPEYKQPL